jgi:hypothetical protein
MRVHEEREQAKIDEERLPERRDRRRVDGLRHDEIADESGGIEEGDKEDRVTDGAIGEDERTIEDGGCGFHGIGFGLRWRRGFGMSRLR